MSQRVLRCIQCIFILQCLGLAGLAWVDGSKLSVFLFLETSLSESVTLQVNWGIIASLLGLATAVLFRLRPVYFLLAGLAFFIEALLTAYLAGDYAAKYALFAQSTRYGWLLILGSVWYLAADKHLSDGLQIWLRRGLSIVLAVTFLTHGFEALSHHPKFIDLLLVASHKILAFSATEGMARGVLILIGLVDIGCAILILFRCRPALLYYMAIWGGVTALARVVDGGLSHLPDTLVRSAHWGIPLLVLYLTADQKSLPSSGHLIFANHRLWRRISH